MRSALADRSLPPPSGGGARISQHPLVAAGFSRACRSVRASPAKAGYKPVGSEWRGVPAHHLLKQVANAGRLKPTLRTRGIAEASLDEHEAPRGGLAMANRFPFSPRLDSRYED